MANITMKDLEHMADLVGRCTVATINYAKNPTEANLQAANKCMDKISHFFCETHGTTVNEVGMQWVQDDPEGAIKDLEQAALYAGVDPKGVIPAIEAELEKRAHEGTS